MAQHSAAPRQVHQQMKRCITFSIFTDEDSPRNTSHDAVACVPRRDGVYAADDGVVHSTG